MLLLLGTPTTYSAGDESPECPHHSTGVGMGAQRRTGLLGWHNPEPLRGEGTLEPRGAQDPFLSPPPPPSLTFGFGIAIEFTHSHRIPCRETGTGDPHCAMARADYGAGLPHTRCSPRYPSS